MPFKTAVIGYGFSATIFHLPFLDVLPDFKVVGIVQRNPTEKSDCTKDRAGVKRYADASEVWADEEVELVVITTAPDTHVEFCKKALESGKNVICEKPFTPTYTEAAELAKLAESKGLLLAVFQNRRFDADFLTVSKLIALGDDTLGRLATFETHFDRHRPIAPAASSGWKITPGPASAAIYDLGTHLLDQIYVLFGVPDRITAWVGSQRVENPTNYDDSFTVTCHYDSRKLTAKAEASIVSPEENQLRFWLRGEKGSFKKYHLDVQEGQLLGGARPGTSNSFGFEPAENYGTLTRVTGMDAAGKNPILKSEIFPSVEPATYTEFYRQVARALKGERPNPVPASQAAEVIRMIEAALQSSKEERTVKL